MDQIINLKFFHTNCKKVFLPLFNKTIYKPLKKKLVSHEETIEETNCSEDAVLKIYQKNHQVILKVCK